VNIAYPYRFDTTGRTAGADDPTHLRDLISQVLFTAPGERVMVPEFGCGARTLVFQGNDEVLAAATEFTIAKALQATLGRLVMVNAVHVASDNDTLHVEVVYTKSRDLERERVVFQLLPREGTNRE
jgi:Bacteriophage baseplate protein W